ncbi:MAG: hypothetical protein WA966_07250 [Ornithinimicrobium sp.]
MTIQPTPGADDSSLDDGQQNPEDQNHVDAEDLEPTDPDTDGDASHNGDDAQPDDTEKASDGGGQVSEAGGASLNAETTLGGADALPDAHG